MHELTMSEHRKELIYENFEARPRRSPAHDQLFPKVVQKRSVILPSAPKRAKMYSVMAQGNKSGNRSPVPEIYMQPPAAK